MSGEAVADPEGENIVDAGRLNSFADQVARALDESEGLLQIAVVVGGGNILRGKSLEGVGRTRADHMGMLATVINALALQDAFENHEVDSRVMTGIECPKVAEPHIYGRAMKHLNAGRVVIFAGGTGDPYFTTDTAAALRASEIEADSLLLAKYGTEGVYDNDPNLDADAKMYRCVSYDAVMSLNLQIMDMTAVTLCKEQAIPIYVFNMQEEEAVVRALLDQHRTGTTISESPEIAFRSGAETK